MAGDKALICVKLKGKEIDIFAEKLFCIFNYALIHNIPIMGTTCGIDNDQSNISQALIDCFEEQTNLGYILIYSPSDIAQNKEDYNAFIKHIHPIQIVNVSKYYKNKNRKSKQEVQKNEQKSKQHNNKSTRKLPF